MWTLYNIGIYVYGLLIFIAALFNDKAKKRYNGQRETFKYLKGKIDKDAHYVWFHAASLGEFEQARPLIEKLRERKPEYKILLTFFSPSGYEVRKDYKFADLVCYMPLDTFRNASKFVKMVEPKEVIFVKYEFWPNFLLVLWKKKIKTYIVSAHFRDNQAFFKWYGIAYAKVLKVFKMMFVQDMHSVELLKKIGIGNAVVAGDTRFDRVVEIAEKKKELPIAENFRNNEKVLIAGSSWPQDEELLIEYAKERNVKLLLAPHEIHESHLSEIEKIWNATEGRRLVRYSNATAENIKDAGCLLIDNMGMLSSLYQYGTVAYIGGGFGVGIHNVLEAAVYGMPVVFGPNYKAFREAVQLTENGGGFSISNYEELRKRMDALLKEPSEAGRKAGEYVSANRGATDKTLNEIFG